MHMHFNLKVYTGRNCVCNFWNMSMIIYGYCSNLVLVQLSAQNEFLTFCKAKSFYIYISMLLEKTFSHPILILHLKYLLLAQYCQIFINRDLLLCPLFLHFLYYLLTSTSHRQTTAQWSLNNM